MNEIQKDINHAKNIFGNIKPKVKEYPGNKKCLDVTCNKKATKEIWQGIDGLAGFMFHCCDKHLKNTLKSIYQGYQDDAKA